MDTTIFLPLYKTFFPIIITLFSLFFFNESLNFKEGLGIVCGIIVPLMLITKTENKLQKNLKIGLLMMLLTSIGTSIATVFSKKAMALDLDVNLFLMLVFISGSFISGCSYFLFNNKLKNSTTKKGVYLFAAGLSTMQYLSSLAFVNALKGNLAIVVTINSFSILIPIILSVIFYKEEMTMKKAFVIFLSIVSVILFI